MKYYSLSFYHNFLNVFQHRFCGGLTDKCRHCLKDIETVDHVFIDCNKLDTSEIKLVCSKNNITFNLKNIITNFVLKIAVEKFIKKYY